MVQSLAEMVSQPTSDAAGIFAGRDPPLGFLYGLSQAVGKRERSVVDATR